MDNLPDISIGLVGPCKSGKTVLKRELLKHSLRVKHIAQEHSYTPDMWKRISNPDILVYLSVSYETTLERSSLNWNKNDYEVQLQRLTHAREHADMIIETDHLTPEQIAEKIIEFISKSEISRK